MRVIDIESWRGQRDSETLEPSTMRFIAAPGKTCAGCLFDRQHSSVCRKAAYVAARAGLADCDSGFVYVAVEVDPRQLDLPA